jgi:RimJ/RimL family protein N-acetyltransferase
MPYPLTTARLRIEPLTADDIEQFVAYRRDPSVARWQSWEPSYSADDARRLVAGQPATELPDPGGWIQLAIRDRDAKNLFGDAAVHTLAEQPQTFEIGITLAPRSQGHGIGTEAVARVLEFLFVEAAAHRVVGQCDARNRPVAKLLSRVGMRHEARQIEADYYKGEWTTLDSYAILARERVSE